MLLVGVVKYDLEGAGRLERLLEQRKPHRITLEYPAIYSPDKLAAKIAVFRTKLVSFVKQRDVPENVRSFLETIFGN